MVFGGWDAPMPYNDLFILDLRELFKHFKQSESEYLMQYDGYIKKATVFTCCFLAGTVEWREPEVVGKAPSPRRLLRHQCHTLSFLTANNV